MPSNPSIKGASISSLIEDVAKQRDSGRIPRELLEERLTEADRELLDRPVNVASWYDIHSYRRMAELLCETEGRREDLMRERGAAAAKRLAAAGLYQQMETASRIDETRQLDESARFEAYGRRLKLIATLSGAILNFGEFRVVIDPDSPDRYCIEVHDAADMPELLAHTSEGFINAMAEMGASESATRKSTWKLEQEAGILRYRMTQPV
jgi:hypothetical protein